MRKLLWLFASIFALVFTDCDVHEFPDSEPEIVTFVEVELNLDFVTELPPFRDYIYESYMTSGRGPNYNVRYQVKFYAPEDQSTRRSVDDRTPIYQFMFITSPSDLGLKTKVSIPPGEYRVHVWADYVEAGVTSDNFYYTSDFSAISLLEPYRGCDDGRDAFRGIGTAIVSEDKDSYIHLEMVRPMAKYKFIATDLDVFLSRTHVRGEASNTPITINPEDYIVQFRYTGFMPSEFNMFTDRPSDARAGVTFIGKMVPLSDTEAEIGYDYVLVNGHESTVSVAVDVFSKDGKLLATSYSVDVPLKRSTLTTVRGNFLTSSASAGVGVNPEFDGEFNYPVH